VIATETRDLAPDALRGIALLGILIVNIPFMAMLSTEGARGVWVEGLGNGISTALMIALFAGKFYILFAFLFGYSASYFIKGERSNRGRWARRSIGLMLFGTLHFTFFWHGDILFLYGVLGLLLIPFLFRSDRTLKIWTRIIYSLFAAILSLAAFGLLFAERFFPEEVEREISNASQLDEVLRDGTFLDAVLPRLELWTFGIVTGILLQGGFVFAAFLFGLRLGREKTLSRPTSELNLSKWIKVMCFVGLPIQATAAIIAVINEQSASTSEATYLAALVVCFVTAPLLTAGYVALFLRWVEKGSKPVMWLRQAGRMSLTLYITQSVLVSLIFAPWGLGLFQEIPLWAVFIIAILVWATLVRVANLWLARFSQGPLERVMRLFTNPFAKQG
jgi:uncharacterized protein